MGGDVDARHDGGVFIAETAVILASAQADITLGSIEAGIEDRLGSTGRGSGRCRSSNSVSRDSGSHDGEGEESRLHYVQISVQRVYVRERE